MYTTTQLGFVINREVYYGGCVIKPPNACYGLHGYKNYGILKQSRCYTKVKSHNEYLRVGESFG